MGTRAHHINALTLNSKPSFSYLFCLKLLLSWNKFKFICFYIFSVFYNCVGYVVISYVRRLTWKESVKINCGSY